jgi:hypothetical protein
VRSPAFARGAIARCDHAQIVLTRELDADAGRRHRRARVDLFHFRRRQIGAVGIEPLDETAHGAVHHFVDVRFFHVARRDESDRIVEDLEVLVGVFARHHLAEEAPTIAKAITGAEMDITIRRVRELMAPLTFLEPL